uniref:G-protein coupled receptors family 1 profile domain-containing protein n=1 Tax=Panagrolaimus superbus TaxID=310955 RepID=A0A914Z4V8_9BILA
MSLNISVFEQTKQILPVYWAYCGLGILAVIANLIVIIVYLSSPQLRSIFALFIGLAIAEGINGAAFLVTGIERIISEYSLQNVYSFPIVSRGECALQVGNSLLIIGSQAPAMLSMTLGIERFCAIKFPTKYRQFKQK